MLGPDPPHLTRVVDIIMESNLKVIRNYGLLIVMVFLEFAIKINGQEFPNETPALNTSTQNKINLLLSNFIEYILNF
jgi:hypothetical protein